MAFMRIENKRMAAQIFWWISAVLLFVIVFATAPRLYYAAVVFIKFMRGVGIILPLEPVGEKTRFLREIIAPIKGLIFIFSLVGLLPPLIKDVIDSWK
jgi:hypothetical protein